MTPEEFLPKILVPGLTWLTQTIGPKPPASREARLMILAIDGQESAWTDRVQGGAGPAHGFAQFERAGGVAGVLNSTSTAHWAAMVCSAVPVPADATHVWGMMATTAGDNLATAFARLLLWTSPARLPTYGDEATSWLYYEHLWRPGKPDRARWHTRYAQALAADKAYEQTKGQP